MKYHAIIFDMDGTIIDSEQRWNEATLHLLETKSFLPRDKALELLPRFKGASSYDSCSFMKKAYGLKESVKQLMQEKDDFVFKNFAQLVTFIDGFETFHAQATKLSLKSAIATNAHKHSLDLIKKHIQLHTFFNEHIYGIEQVQQKAKPLPDIYLFAAKQLQVDPTLCIAIEDSAHGICAAKAAGMFCIGINSGNDKHALRQADIIIDHYDQIALESLLYNQ